MDTDYEWLRQRRRNRRQEEQERAESALDEALEEGFRLLQDDADESDSFGTDQHTSKGGP